jgi:hypothetical protein
MRGFDMDDYGLIEGDTCNRNGCLGVMREIDTDGCCSCHTNPPCSYCTDKEFQCDLCESLVEAPVYESSTKNNDDLFKNWKSPHQRYIEMDGSKIEWIVLSHTHFSQICKGRMPKGTTTQQVRDAGVNGTFGGRFTSFGETHFEFVAYTD